MTKKSKRTKARPVSVLDLGLTKKELHVVMGVGDESVEAKCRSVNLKGRSASESHYRVLFQAGHECMAVDQGCSPQTVIAWRQSLGLPSPHPDSMSAKAGIRY